MKKEELIHLHVLLFQFKNFCEEQGLDYEFKKYKALNISPYQIDRSKIEHKRAIFVLASELVSMTVTRWVNEVFMKKQGDSRSLNVQITS